MQTNSEKLDQLQELLNLREHYVKCLEDIEHILESVQNEDSGIHIHIFHENVESVVAETEEVFDFIGASNFDVVSFAGGTEISIELLNVVADVLGKYLTKCEIEIELML